jgi:hypothetical protein
MGSLDLYSDSQSGSGSRRAKIIYKIIGNSAKKKVDTRQGSVIQSPVLYIRGPWICIRIRIQILNPDPDPGGQNLSTKSSEIVQRRKSIPGKEPSYNYQCCRSWVPGSVSGSVSRFAVGIRIQEGKNYSQNHRK